MRRLLLLLLPVAALSSAASPASADDGEVMPPSPPDALAVPALSGPEEIDAFDHDRPTPIGYTVVKRTRKGLLLGGGITFAASYTASLALADDEPAAGRSWFGPIAIPLAGPFLVLAQTDDQVWPLTRLFFAVLGGAQTTGVILMIIGLTAKKSVLVRNDIVGSMTFAPMAGDGTTGMVLSGRF